jgi:hypothetical protein
MRDMNFRNIPQRAAARLKQTLRRLCDNTQIARQAVRVAAHVPPARNIRPIVFFKASTGLADFTYNNAFHILAAWGLRLKGVPVIHFVCQRGMSLCVMGTHIQNPTVSPPCNDCIRHANAMYKGATVHRFGFESNPSLCDQLAGLTVPELMAFEYIHGVGGIDSPIPLGALVTPGLRWILRRHHLVDGDPIRYLYRAYIQSAWNVAVEFNAFVVKGEPQAVVVFNGQFFPEAIAAWIARQHGIRVVTHEVGLQPFSGFFTDGEATAYPIHIPEEFKLDPVQNLRLDAYLEKRFQGQFSMAGVRFWPEMRKLDSEFLQKAAGFKQIVPVFTNVIFDTSQPHANTVFPEMFAWLETVLDLARNHPGTLFVIRAHPDEIRPGKESQETVEQWVTEQHATDLPNIVFVGPTDYFSSYELIQRAKFVMVYNSTIGLEAVLMGIPVLCAGKARFTQYPMVTFPPSVVEFRSQAESFLSANKIDLPEEYRSNARRFLYYQLYRTSLPFDSFITTGTAPSLTRFKEFTWQQLLPQKSEAIAIILEGLLHKGDFLLKEK